MPDSSPWRSLQPGGRVGADRDVGPPPRGAHAHAGAVRRTADLPRVAHVAQAHVVGRVEARLRAEIPARERAECLMDLLRERRHGRDATCRGNGTRRVRGSLTAPCAKSASTTRRPARCGRWSRASPARWASTPAGRPSTRACTSATRARSSSSPSSSASSSTRGWRRRSWRTSRTSTTRSTTAAEAAGRPSAELAREMTVYYIQDTGRLGLGRPDHEPLATESVDGIVDLIAALVDGGHAYEAGGDVYFRVRSLRRLRRAVAPRRRPDGSGRGGRGRRSQGGSARLRALEGHQGGRGHELGVARGARGRPGWHIECSAMAEQYLGVDFDIHGGGIDLVFPHHENEAAQTLAGRGKPLARVWMHNGMLQLDKEKMSKSRGQHPRARRRARRGRRRGARPVLLRRPLPPADRVLRRAARRGAARGGADPRGGAAPGPGRLARGAGAAARRVLRRAGRRLQHRRAPWRRSTTGSARPTGARARSAARTCARCSTCSGSPRCWTPPAGPPAEAVELGRAPRRRPRRPRLGRGRPAARRAARDGLGGPRWPAGTGTRPGGLTARAAAASRGAGRASRRAAADRRATSRRGRASPRRAEPPAPPADVVYGRNAVREALRGRRRVKRVWATAATAKEGFAGAPVSRTRTRSPRGAAPTPTRASARRSTPYPYADAAELLAARGPVHRRARRGHRPAEPRRGDPHGRVRGRDRRRHPRAALGRGDGRGRKASAGAVEHLPVARVRNLADFLGEAKEAGCWTYGAAAGAAHALRRPGLLRRGRPGARRGGSRAAAAGRRRVRRARLAPAARAHRFAQRQRRRGGPHVRDLAEKA